MCCSWCLILFFQFYLIIDYATDPPIYTAGRAIVSMSSSLLVGEATTDYIIMPAAEIQEAGTLIGFEYYTHTPGAVQFYVSILHCLYE